MNTRHDRRLSKSWTYEQSAHAHFSIWQNFSRLCSQMINASIKSASKCSFIGAHYSVSWAATAMLKVFNLTIVKNKWLDFIFHKIPHLLNWIEINLFANMGLDSTAITCSCTDSIWVLTVLTLFSFICLKKNYGFLVGSFLCLHYTVEPRFNELLGTTDNIFRPGKKLQ